MKKNEPKKPAVDTKPKAPEKAKVPQKAHKDSKAPVKEHKAPIKEAKKQAQKHEEHQKKAPVQEKEKEKPMESMDMPLGGIAAVLQSDDKRCVYLVDETGNSYTFFKYKGRLIDIPSSHLDIHVKNKPRESVMEEIRKQLLFGLKQGEAVVIHVGSNEIDIDQFFKGETFWDPKNLFRSPATFDTEWYRSNIMKAEDKDIFGNVGSFFPSKEFVIFVSMDKDVQFDNVKWLHGTKKEFRRIKIL